MKKLLIFIFILLGLSFANKINAANYLLNGGQDSQIDYEMTQHVEVPGLVNKLILTFVKPKDFVSPTYNQKIKNLNFVFSPKPNNKREYLDKRGNTVLEAVWNNLDSPVTTNIQIQAINNVKLSNLKTVASFPLKISDLPDEAKVYLNPSEQVQSNQADIKNKAYELTNKCQTEFDAVQKIISWLVDHVHYVLTPVRYDALYSFETGKGNCQNYSHLAAALMRVVGIPARIINGITLKKPYDIQVGESFLTMAIVDGRHSWIEVFFPDLGWVPFDPQGTVMYVSNRFIRVEAGIDNNETRQDGLIRWFASQNLKPNFKESINSEFPFDKVNILGKKMPYGPRALLLSPKIDANFSQIPTKHDTDIPETPDTSELKNLKYTKPYFFGNLDFPENIDLSFSRGPVQDSQNPEDDAGFKEVRKNFLIETSEYVTTQGKQYVQAFIIRKPMKINKIGLALRKFSDDGQIWIDIFKNKAGMPDEIITTSKIFFVSEIASNKGYSWLDFSFNKDILLAPGKYWMALSSTDKPIINWFFTYGNSSGLESGAKYKTIFDKTWSRSLNFEFNYKISGYLAD